jgi:hypothetical protein
MKHNPGKQNVRTTGAPVADVSRNRALAVDYTRRDPSATVTAGRRTLGYLFDESDGRCTALSFERAVIGTFANRREARLAILVEPKGPTPA